MAIRISDLSAVPLTASGSAKMMSYGFSMALKAAQTAGNQKKSMDDIFAEASEKYQVPVNLLRSVAKAESGFQADAVSCCGAQGVMQLMPATARSLGVEDPFDAEQNIMGGAKYLGSLLNRYGDTKLALAAYNAGSGNVEKYGGVPPFQETQNYVEKVMSYAGDSTGLSSKIESGNIAGSLFGGESEILSGSLFSAEDYRKFLELFAESLREDALNSVEGLENSDSSFTRNSFLPQ